MKLSIYISSVLILFFTECTSENGKELEGGSGDFTLQFREYKVDTCLSDLLWSIAEADSSRRFPPGLYCYMLLFSKATKYRTIIIYPMPWTKYLPKGCTGLIEVGNISFLCCGNFTADPLFVDTKKDVVKHIHAQGSFNLDSLDTPTDLLDWENSPTALIGSYRMCQGSPIDLYINVGTTLKGVEKKDSFSPPKR